MAALAKSMGVKTVVGLQARQSPSIQKVQMPSPLLLPDSIRWLIKDIQAKEIIMSGALGRILSTSLVGYDSVINKLPEKAIVFQDPANGRYITLPVSNFSRTMCIVTSTSYRLLRNNF